MFFFSLSLCIMSLFLWFFFLLALSSKLIVIIIFSFFILFIFNYVDIIASLNTFRIIIASHKYLKISISSIIIYSTWINFSFLIFDLSYSFQSFPSFLFYIISYNMHWAFFLRFKCIYIFFIFQKNIKFNFILLHRFVILG